MSGRRLAEGVHSARVFESTGYTELWLGSEGRSLLSSPFPSYFCSILFFLWLGAEGRGLLARGLLAETKKAWRPCCKGPAQHRRHVHAPQIRQILENARMQSRTCGCAGTECLSVAAAPTAQYQHVCAQHVPPHAQHSASPRCPAAIHTRAHFPPETCIS